MKAPQHVRDAIHAEVALAGRVLAANGHDDFIWGHIAARDPAGRGVWMKPSGLGFSEVRAADVLLLDFEGSVIFGTGRRHAEWPIHTAVMLARSDVGAVVHTHPKHCIALAAASLDLLPLSHSGSVFVPPAVPRFDLTAGLIADRDLGAALADTLGGSDAVFMLNHGIVVCGRDIGEAVSKAVLLERACEQQLIALAASKDLTYPDSAASLAKREQMWGHGPLTALWEHLARSCPIPPPP